MNSYLISYDLGLPESVSDYLVLFSYLKTYSGWARPLKSVWLIKTDKNITDVRDEINKLIDSNDRVLVIDVTKNHWATYNLSKEVTDWMANNI